MNNEVEIMRVVRIPPRGQLIVEIGDKRYSSIDEIEQRETRVRVIAAIGELASFAGGYKALADAGYAPSMTMSSDGGKPAGSETPLTPEQANFIASLEAQNRTVRNSIETPEPKVTLMNALRAPKRPTPKPDQPPALKANLTVAEQINDILQTVVAQDPTLANRSIRLQQAAAGGLKIIVDGEQFDRPGEISDRNVQLAIKKALSKWDAT